MSKKIKNSPAKKGMINPNTVNLKTSEEYPVFSFRYLTTNKNYTLDCFAKAQKNERGRTANELFLKLLFISNNSWKNLGLSDKYTSYETIQYVQLNFQPNELIIKPDEKIHIFRFGHDNNSRLICYKKNTTLFIIGYDFNFSAYDHGS